MTSTEQTEYTELRATIRERGTARVWVFVVDLIAWAGLTLAIASLAAPPLSALVSLVVLAAGFEAVFALHVGVERVGRYVQIAHEVHGRGWEHAAMSFGRPKGAVRVDPLFAIPFALAAVLNLLPALLAGPTREELIFVGGAHALLLLRIVAARTAATRQRAVDLARFEQLRSDERRESTKPTQTT